MTPEDAEKMKEMVSELHDQHWWLKHEEARKRFRDTMNYLRDQGYTPEAFEKGKKMLGDYWEETGVALSNMVPDQFEYEVLQDMQRRLDHDGDNLETIKHARKLIDAECQRRAQYWLDFSRKNRRLGAKRLSISLYTLARNLDA